MKFIEFEMENGRRIFVNIAAIADVYETRDGCRIDFVSGVDDYANVKGSYEEVRNAIRRMM